MLDTVTVDEPLLMVVVDNSVTAAGRLVRVFELPSIVLFVRVWVPVVVTSVLGNVLLVAVRSLLLKV